MQPSNKGVKGTDHGGYQSGMLESLAADGATSLRHRPPRAQATANARSSHTPVPLPETPAGPRGKASTPPSPCMPRPSQRLPS